MSQYNYLDNLLESLTTKWHLNSQWDLLRSLISKPI
jgi:hypothetical protein